MQEILPLHRFTINKSTTYPLKESTFDELTGTPTVTGELEFLRKYHQELGDIVFITGELQVNWTANCVKCLEAIEIDDSFPLALVLINQTHSDSHYIDEELTYFDQNAEFDVFFYEMKKIPLKSIIHEFIHLNEPRHPSHGDECKGLCPTCGKNLNFEVCDH